MDEMKRREKLLLNYQGFRGKFHILEVCCDGGDKGIVAKQIRDRGYHWGEVAGIDRSLLFKEASLPRSEVDPLFAAATVIEIPTGRVPHRGKDGTWYTLDLGEESSRRVISWWSDREPELRPLYQLRDQIVEVVMRSLRSSRD